MRYTVKNFQNDGDQKFVGLYITDDLDRVFVIDKRMPLQDGKTPEQYVADALALCQDEIAEWQASYGIVGKTFDAETGTFV